MGSAEESLKRARCAGPRKPQVVAASEASATGPMTIGEFHKALDRLSPSHSRYENFRNFMEAAYAALARRTVLSRAGSDALEERYAAVMRRYAREPEVPQRMAELFGRTVWTLSKASGDFLGEAYMTAAFGNKYAGQFFTPFCVSSLMARMIVTGEDIAEARAQGRAFHLTEPTAGAGGMVIAVAEWIQEQGFDWADALFATLIDIDLLCVQMSFVQLCAKGIPAVCVHGNSLGLEEYASAYTMAGARQRGLPIWRIGESPPEGFSLDLPPVLNREILTGKSARATRAADQPAPCTSATDAGNTADPEEPLPSAAVGQIPLF